VTFRWRKSTKHREGDRSCVRLEQRRVKAQLSFLKPRVSRLRLEWLKNYASANPPSFTWVQPASSYGSDNWEISSRHFVDVGNPDWDKDRSHCLRQFSITSWRTTPGEPLKSPTLLATRASTPEALNSTAATSETPTSVLGRSVTYWLRNLSC
jgi:hypothetical protein